MERKDKFSAISDEELYQAAGGYLVVSEWRGYVANTVMRDINHMMINASGNDQAILNSVSSVFQSTMIPGAAVADPIRNLWNDFNVNYQNLLESQDIKSRLGSVISAANNYISQHS